MDNKILNRSSNACTVAVMSRKDGVAGHDVVQQLLAAKARTAPRAGYARDGRTTDGDGSEFIIPQAFFGERYDELQGQPLKDRKLAVGMMFLPRHIERQQRAKFVFEEEIRQEGLTGWKWRDVPHDKNFMGPIGLESLPDPVQILLPLNDGDTLQHERMLARVRERAKKRWRNEGIDGPGANAAHTSSLSSTRIIYKARTDPRDVGQFWLDLLNPKFITRMAVGHARFTTAGDTSVHNIQPVPGGTAHNGTIVTVNAFRRAIYSHQQRLMAQFGEGAKDLFPLFLPGDSDSANMDRLVELLALSGLTLPEIKMTLIGRPLSRAHDASAAVKEVLRWKAAEMADLDGPLLAVMISPDGRYINAVLDVNANRPGMVVETDKYICIGSETGMWDFNQENDLTRTDELEAGAMMMIDTQTGRIYDNHELEEQVAAETPYRHWSEEYIKDFGFEPQGDYEPRLNENELNLHLRLAGYADEDITRVLDYMGGHVGEPRSGMGDYTRRPGSSTLFRPESHFYKLGGVQITAPPHNADLDGDIMDLIAYDRNPIGNDGQPRETIKFKSFIITNDQLRELEQFYQLQGKLAVIDCTFDPSLGDDALTKARKSIGDQAVAAAKEGKHVISLKDLLANEDRAPGFMMRAIGEANRRLIEEGLRGDVMIVPSGGGGQTSHEASLWKMAGATLINFPLAEEAVRSRARAGKIKDPEGRIVDENTAAATYYKGLEKYTLESMQRSGTQRASSWENSHVFETNGLRSDLAQEVHPGIASHGSGWDEAKIQETIAAHHKETFHQYRAALAQDSIIDLNTGGRFTTVPGGEVRAQDALSIRLLQAAVENDDEEEGYGIFQAYTAHVHGPAKAGVYVRDDLEFIPPKNGNKTENAEKAAAVERILKSVYGRIVGGAMSVAAIALWVHKDIHEAANKLGVKTSTGEGGYQEELLGTKYMPKIVQWSTAAFGIRPQLLKEADVIEFKFGQGAKLDKGGEMDGSKVVDDIAENRFVEPGTTLKSPPQHADMLSIEDLKQKIKLALTINPAAEIRIKIVAKDGCEDEAVGAAKAMQNAFAELEGSIPGLSGKMSILLAGGRGGTGNASLPDIYGSANEIEHYTPRVSQALEKAGLRKNVKLIVDGGMRSGIDLIKMLALNADAIGFGTILLYALGCRDMGRCNEGNAFCAPAVATTNPDMRENYNGKSIYVERLFKFIARQAAEKAVELGYDDLQDMVGVAQAILRDISPPEIGYDYGPMFAACNSEDRYEGPLILTSSKTGKSIDAQILESMPSLAQGASGDFTFLNVPNTAVATGGYIAGKLSKWLLTQTRDLKKQILPDDNLIIRLTGYPGFATFPLFTQGMTGHLRGIADACFAQGNHKGIVTLRFLENSRIAEDSIIAGNCTNSFSTGGRSYIVEGRVGHGASFRLSGGTNIYAGMLDKAAQFMTRGSFAAFRWGVGRNSFANMSGGEAFVRHEGKTHDAIAANFNSKTIQWSPLQNPDAIERLRMQMTEAFERAYKDAKLIDPKETYLGRMVKQMKQGTFDYSEFIHITPKPRPSKPSRETVVQVLSGELRHG